MRSTPPPPTPSPRTMLLGRHHRRPSTPPHTTTTTNSDDHSDSDDTFFVPRPQKRPPCEKRRCLTRTSAPVLPSTTPLRPYGDVGFGNSATSRNPSPRAVKSDRYAKIGNLRTDLRAIDDEFCDVSLGTNTASLRNPNYSDDPNKETTEKPYNDSDPNRNTDTSTKSSLYNDEFCDVSLENSLEVRNANPDTSRTTRNGNNVRKNLRQIASKIRVGPKLAQGNTTGTNPTLDPGDEDSSSQVDLPPFAAFSDPSGRVSDASGVLPKGFQCLKEGNHGLKPSQQPSNSSDPRDEDMGVLSKRILASREDCQAPQQPPCGIVGPPVGYGGLSSLMCEADDTTFADSDSATAGSDSGVLCASSRRRRTSSSVEEKREERGGGEEGGGGIGGRVRERIATWVEEGENNGGRGGGSGSHEPSRRKPSLVDGLLLSIYRHHQRNRSSSIGESDTLTEHSTTSEPPFPPPPATSRYHRGRAFGCSSSSSLFFVSPPPPPPPPCSSSSTTRVVLRKFRLLSKDVAELRLLVSSLQASLSGQCALLVRELKKRDKLRHRRDHRNDLITAVLHALSLKRSQDTRMRFSVAPLPGDSGFRQWHDAMMMCARLPGGIPQEFRRRLWLTLAEKHLQARGVSWPHAESFCFNEWSNPDDDELGDQIVKDLHRTGCSLFCGEDAEDNQAMLKRVLLAFARWNKGVGYCQGFNMLAAIILEVMERQESDALKVMIYLIEGVLPESYFANNLRGLSVDMAVFRDLLRLHLPHLSRHLEHLQHDAADLTTGTIYEPPLTNVFTMQWFLTLFSNCLPRDTVMRVWDLTFLQGNEVLLRTALAIWDRLARRILEVHSADEFYTVMGLLTREMLSTGLMDANKLVQTVVGMAPFPFPGLAELRDKYTYNITPWTQSVSSVAKRGLRLFYSDDDDEDNDEDDDQTIAVATAFGLSGIFRKSAEINRGSSPVGGPVMSPCGYPVSAAPLQRPHESRELHRPNLDISALKKQYARLRERQKQAHIILTASQQRVSSTLGGGVGVGVGVVGGGVGGGGQRSTPLTMNHLLRGKKALTSKTKRVVPRGVIPPAMKPKKKAERKLSDSSSNRPTPQQSQQSLKPRASTQGTITHYHTLKRPPKGSDAPPKVETLHWKDTPRRDRRASLPSGVKFLEGSSSTSSSLGVLVVAEEMDDEGDNGSSTSTELCDDDEDDKLSDLETDAPPEPRPATTSPRLETVKETRTASPDPAKAKKSKEKALKVPKQSVGMETKARVLPETKESAVTETKDSVMKDVKDSALPEAKESKESVLEDGKESALEKTKVAVLEGEKEKVLAGSEERDGVTLADGEPSALEEAKNSVLADGEVIVLADDKLVVLPDTETSVAKDTKESELAEATDVTLAEDQNIQQVSYPFSDSTQTAPTDTQGPDLPSPSSPTTAPSTILGTDAQPADTDNQNSQSSTQGYPSNDQLPLVSQVILETMTSEALPGLVEDPVQPSEVIQGSVKDQEAEDAPLWDLKSGIPLEDLLAKKNLTAAEIIARIPFPSDVSFMKDSQDAASMISRNISLHKTEGTGSPFSTLHNVTPERSPIDSPVLRMPADSLLHDPIRTPPSTSPSKSPTTFSTPSPRDSPILRPSKSPTLSPTGSQSPKESSKRSLVGLPSPTTSRSPVTSPTDALGPLGPINWSLVGLPSIHASDILQEPSLIPPKSPKITVEDEKRNIFEIYEGYAGGLSHEEDLKNIAEDEILEVSNVKEGIFHVKDLKEENNEVNTIKLGSLEKSMAEETLDKTHGIHPEMSDMTEEDFLTRHAIHPSLSLDQITSSRDMRSDMTVLGSDMSLEERIRELFGQVTAQITEESECAVDGPVEAVNIDAVKGFMEDVNQDAVVDGTEAVNGDDLSPVDGERWDAVKTFMVDGNKDAVGDVLEPVKIDALSPVDCENGGAVKGPEDHVDTVTMGMEDPVQMSPTKGDVQQRVTSLFNDSQFEPRTGDEDQTGASFSEAPTSKSGYLCLTKPTEEAEPGEGESERGTLDQNKVFSAILVPESLVERPSEKIPEDSNILESRKTERETDVVLGTPTSPESPKAKEESEVILGTSSVESPVDNAKEMALGTPSPGHQIESLDKETDLLLGTSTATTESQMEKEKEVTIGTPSPEHHKSIFTAGGEEERELLLGTTTANNESPVKNLSHPLSGTSSWLSVMCMSVCKDANTSPSHARPIVANTIISEHQNRVVRISPEDEMRPVFSVFTTTATTTITTTAQDSTRTSTPEGQTSKTTTQLDSTQPVTNTSASPPVTEKERSFTESIDLVNLSSVPKVSKASQGLLPSQSIAGPLSLVGLSSVPCVSPSKVSKTSPGLLPSSLSPLYTDGRVPELPSVSLQGEGLSGFMKQITSGLSISPAEREDVVPLFTVDEGKSFKGFDLASLASEEPQGLFKGFDLTALSSEEPQSILVSLASEEPQGLFKGFNLTSMSSEEPQSLFKGINLTSMSTEESPSLFKGFNLTSLASEESQSLFKGFDLTSMSSEEPPSLFKGFDLTSLASEEPQSLLASLATEESQSLFTNDKMSSIKFSVLDQMLTSETMASGPPAASSSSSSSFASSTFSTVLKELLTSESSPDVPPVTSSASSLTSYTSVTTTSISFSPSFTSLPSGPLVTTSTSTSSSFSSLPVGFPLSTIPSLKTTPTSNTSVTFSLLNNPDLRCALATPDLMTSLPVTLYPRDQLSGVISDSMISDTETKVRLQENEVSVRETDLRESGNEVSNSSSGSDRLVRKENSSNSNSRDISSQETPIETSRAESRKAGSSISSSSIDSSSNPYSKDSGFNIYNVGRVPPKPSLSLDERISAILGANTSLPGLVAPCDGGKVSEEPAKEEEEKEKGYVTSWKPKAAQYVKEEEEEEKERKDEEMKEKEEKEVERGDEKEETREEKTNATAMKEEIKEKGEMRENEVELEEKRGETRRPEEERKEDRVTEEKERDETEEEEEEKEEENKRSSRKSNIPFTAEREKRKEKEEEKVDEKELIRKSNMELFSSQREKETKEMKKEEEKEAITTALTTTTTTNTTFIIPNWEEEQASFPIIPLERESSLSASLEGRLSLFTRYEEEEEEEEEESEERSEGKNKDHEEDHEAENETDFFNGKDLSSEAIRQRLWRGVKSLSLDADVSLDPDLFCYLIEQSSKHCRGATRDGDQRRSMPKRRNSEVALQELVKENTEIIERILRQKSLETSTPLRKEFDDKEDRDRHSGLSSFIKLLRQRSENERSPESDSRKTSPMTDLPQSNATTSTTTTKPSSSASSSSSTTTDSIKPSSSSSSSSSKPSKQLSPLYLKAFTPERKSTSRKEESPTVQSPTRSTKKGGNTTSPSPIKSPSPSVARKEGLSPAQSTRNVSARSPTSPTNSKTKKEIPRLSPTHPVSKKGDLSPSQSTASRKGENTAVLSPGSPTKKESASPTKLQLKEVSSPTSPISKSGVLSPSQSTLNKTENKTVLSPLSPTQPKTKHKREDSVPSVLSPVSPRQPIAFNPFPTRNVPRQPKEITVKLGLYSPSKKTTTSS